jgi:chemotaxis protein CheD
MRLLAVDIADFKVSRDPDVVLVTYALGSCIAVMLHDPVRKVAGMIHYMLPQAATSPEKAKTKPAMFADTGIPLLFQAMYAQGCAKQDLVVKVAGGAALMAMTDIFEIGKRNHLILRKMLWKAGVTITAEDVGGTVFRTTRLFVGTGRLTIKTDTKEYEL